MNDRHNFGSGGDPAASIERTLDNQLNALRDIDERTAHVERALESMGVSVT